MSEDSDRTSDDDADGRTAADSDGDERERYHHDDPRSLSDAILEVIERQHDEDIAKAEFQLYDDINPDALDRLFRNDANARTTVQFDTDDVSVTLWGDGAVDIHVRPQDEGPSASDDRP
jgi:hypothetical protein